jgi:hypothetical protein
MAEPITISPDAPANPGLDYSFLRAEGIRILQELAGEIWTDYNESDPGVTILEQLCYALTELSYRAEIPLADLLIPAPGGQIQTRRQALFVPKRIFPCNPVTTGDYRKLIVDRVPQVANVWLTPRRRASTDGVDGLYDIDLYCPAIDPPCTPPEEQEGIVEAVRRLYCRHRGLCEDVERIRILCALSTTVRAAVTVGDGPAPETVLAGLLFNLEQFLAPELRRQPLASLVAEGLAPSRIFDGPLLLNGFVSDAQLQPKPREIRVPEVARVIARSAGVLGVRGVAVEVRREGVSLASGPGGRSCHGDEPIPIPPRCLPRLEIRPGGPFTIRLFRNGIEIRPDAARVERELARLRAAWRRTWRLSAQYQEFFALPQGHYRDVEAYESIQNQFPDVYGINRFGVASSAPESRKAQARQLKGYLLVYDQLLANFFAQLAHARDLCSTAPSPHTYFFQSIEKSVPHVAPLLGAGYHEGLRRIVQGEDDFDARRNLFLDLLLALYGEELGEPSVWRSGESRETGGAGEPLIHAKLALLHHLVAATHNRGRGIDYLERPSRGNLAGLEIKSRIQLGLQPLDPRPLIDVLDELGVKLAEDEAGDETLLARPLPRHADLIAEQFAPLPPFQDAAPPPPSIRGISLPESLLLDEEPGELRLGRLPGDSSLALVFRTGAGGDWRLLGKHAGREAALAAGRAFSSLLGSLRRHSRQLYVVEHTLLRHARVPGFDSSFTVTAVLSQPPGQEGDPEYRRFAREVLRENAPAHVVVETLFLRPARMPRFERLYWAWRWALRRRQDLREASEPLIHFLLEAGKTP